MLLCHASIFQIIYLLFIISFLLFRAIQIIFMDTVEKNNFHDET